MGILRMKHQGLKPMTDTRETRKRNLHEIEHGLFDARNSREKYLAASRDDTRTSFYRELTRTSVSINQSINQSTQNL